MCPRLALDALLKFVVTEVLFSVVAFIYFFMYKTAVYTLVHGVITHQKQ